VHDRNLHKRGKHHEVHKDVVAKKEFMKECGVKNVKKYGIEKV
jgi:hypothetical protein